MDVTRDGALLLVVDVQNCFINGQTEHILGPVNRLVRHWHARKSPVVFSRFINPSGGLWERLRGWPGCQSEPDILLHPGLRRGDDLVIDKHTYSAWETGLKGLCERHGLDSVVLCGVDTNECVLATAISVFDDGLIPFVVRDACASKGAEFHESALKLLEILIGREQVVATDRLLEK